MDSPTIVVFRASKGPEDPYEKVWTLLIGNKLHSLRHLFIRFNIQALSGGGFRVHFVPVLHFQFTNAQDLASAVLDSSRYAGEGVSPSLVKG